MQLKFNGRSAIGRGARPDIPVALANACINVLNRLTRLIQGVKKVGVA